MLSHSSLSLSKRWIYLHFRIQQRATAAVSKVKSITLGGDRTWSIWKAHHRNGSAALVFFLNTKKAENSEVLSCESKCWVPKKLQYRNSMQFHAIPVRPTIVVLRSVKEKQENSGGAIQDSVFPRVFAFAVNVQTSAYHHNPTISTSALRWSLKIPQSQGAVVEENSAIFLGDKQKHIIFPWLVGCDRWWGLFFATFPRVPIPYPGAPGVW